MGVRRRVSRFFGWLGVALSLPIVALWLASYPWALVIAGGDYVGHLSGGAVYYGSYIQFTLPATRPTYASIVAATPTISTARSATRSACVCPCGRSRPARSPSHRFSRSRGPFVAAAAPAATTSPAFAPASAQSAACNSRHLADDLPVLDRHRVVRPLDLPHVRVLRVARRPRRDPRARDAHPTLILLLPLAQ